MYLFALSVIVIASLPLICTNKKRGAAFAIGIFIGGVASMAIWVVTFRHRVAESSFLQNFLYYARTQYSLPLFIFYLIYKGASHKAARIDNNFYKDIRLAFLFGVYSVFAPFNIFCAHQANFGAFELFCVPLLYFSMIVVFVSKIHEAFRVHPPLTIILALTSLATPPAIHSLWTLNRAPVVMYTLFAIFFFYAMALFIIKFARDTQERK